MIVYIYIYIHIYIHIYNNMAGRRIGAEGGLQSKAFELPDMPGDGSGAVFGCRKKTTGRSTHSLLHSHSYIF